MKAEIVKNGPLHTTFEIFESFTRYVSGVYQKLSNETRCLGAHSVKIIGWGEDKGVPYWTIANSWNSGWGEEGYFRILRGSNHCNVEEYCNTGTYQ